MTKLQRTHDRLPSSHAELQDIETAWRSQRVPERPCSLSVVGMTLRGLLRVNRVISQGRWARLLDPRSTDLIDQLGASSGEGKVRPTRS